MHLEKTYKIFIYECYRMMAINLLIRKSKIKASSNKKDSKIN